MSMMFRVRVPAGTRSGRVSRATVLGKALPAPLIKPAPRRPNCPASAGSANTARMPLPPLRLRSRPLPTLMAAGSASRYHPARRVISSSATPQSRASASAARARTSPM